jgi:5-methyltetrahydrofolate--homocysteine methyltransferase
MGIVLEQLAQRKLLVSDGGWGTMLQKAGLEAGDCPEEWNIKHPEKVEAVAAGYARAGSDLVLTNTFGGSAYKLGKQGFGEQVEEFNAAGARASLRAVKDIDGVIVVGSVGPTGEFLEPYGDATEEEMQAVFSQQIAAMLNEGLRAICVETMTAVEEAACAIRAAKALDASVDVICTMTFDKNPNGYRTMMGVTSQQAVAGLTEAGADILGSNCGNGVGQMVPLIDEFRRETDKPLLVHANAGAPQLVDGQTVFQQSPEDFAAKVGDLIEAGAKILGGCCGTTPEHIQAMRDEVDKRR